MGDVQVAFEKSRHEISKPPPGLIVHINILRCTDFKQFHESAFVKSLQIQLTPDFSIPR